MRAAGGEAHALPLDVGDAAAIPATIAKATEQFGGLDFVFNNVGIGVAMGLDDETYDAAWDRQLTVLLTAHQRIMRAAPPWLRRSACARIVNVASTEGLGATRRGSAYAAAKHGVVGLTRAMAIDLGREGITVNCVCPGPVLTGLTERIPPDRREAFARRRTAIGRYAQPEEIAHMILSLCLPAAAFVTGAVIPVDGGLTARSD